MKTITLRDIPPKLAKEIKARAKASGLSYNRTVLRMLEEKPAAGPIGNRLDHHFGTWTDEEADEFDRALAKIRVIDPEMWR